MSIIIKGGSSSNLANVDANNNLNVNTPLSAVTAGFSALVSQNDAGSITGSRFMGELETSSDFRLRVGVDNMVFNDNFNGSAVNSALWTAPVTTMTITVVGGSVSLNAGASVALNAVARLQSYRYFPVYQSYMTYFETLVQFTDFPVAGNVCEWGAFISTGTATPTDGAFFRINAGGELRCVVNNNGTETQSNSLNFSSLVGVDTVRSFLIYLTSREAYFWIDDVLVAKVDSPNAQSTTTSSQSLPFSFRNYNSTAVSTAQIMKISSCNVSFGDQNTSKPWSHIICGGGGHLSQGQTTGTMGSTALYSNSLAAGAGAAMTNTTAALGSGLGGQFSTQPTLAVGSDGIVSSYQVPVGTAIATGRSLYITKVTINSAVTSGLTGGPVLYALSLGYGNTAVSLATTESATTKASRRIPLGFQVFSASATTATLSTPVELTFNAPILVQPGEFVQIIAKNLGTVTSAGVITFLINFVGYWE